MDEVLSFVLITGLLISSMLIIRILLKMRQRRWQHKREALIHQSDQILTAIKESQAEEPYFADGRSAQLSKGRTSLHDTSTMLSSTITEVPREIHPTILDRLIADSRSVLTDDNIDSNPGHYLAHQYYHDMGSLIDEHRRQPAEISAKSEQLQAQKEKTKHSLIGDIEHQTCEPREFIDDAPSRYHGPKEKLKARNTELEDAKSVRSKLFSEAASLTGNARRLRREANDLTPIIEKMSAEVSVKINPIRKQIGGLDSQIEHKESRIEDNRRSIEDNKGRIENYKSRIEDLSGPDSQQVSYSTTQEIDNLRNKIRNDEAKISNCRTNIGRLQSEISGLKSQRTSLHNEMARIKAPLDDKISTQKSLRNQAHRNEARAERLKRKGDRRVHKAEGKVRTATQRLDKERARTDQAQKKVDELVGLIRTVEASTALNALEVTRGKVADDIWAQCSQALDQATRRERRAIEKGMELTEELYVRAMHLWRLSSAATLPQFQYSDLASIEVLESINSRVTPLNPQALALIDKILMINHQAKERAGEIIETKEKLHAIISRAHKAEHIGKLRSATKQGLAAIKQLEALAIAQGKGRSAVNQERESCAEVLSKVVNVVHRPDTLFTRSASGVRGIRDAQQEVSKMRAVADELLRLVKVTRDQPPKPETQVVDPNGGTQLLEQDPETAADGVLSAGDSAAAKDTRRVRRWLTIVVIAVIGISGAVLYYQASPGEKPAAVTTIPPAAPAASLVPVTNTVVDTTAAPASNNNRSSAHDDGWTAQISATTPTTVATMVTTSVPDNPGDAVNCADFATWQEAQDWFDTYAPHYGDVAFMDTNGNGVACEKLLPEGVTVVEVQATLP